MQMMALQHGALSENRPMEAESKAEEMLLFCRGLELEKLTKMDELPIYNHRISWVVKDPQKNQVQH